MSKDKLFDNGGPTISLDPGLPEIRIADPDDMDLFKALKYLEIGWFAEERVEKFKESMVQQKNHPFLYNFFTALATASFIVFTFLVICYFDMITIHIKGQRALEPYSLEVEILTVFFLTTAILALWFCPPVLYWQTQRLEIFTQKIPNKALEKLRQVRALLPRTYGQVYYLDSEFLFELNHDQQYAVVHYWTAADPQAELTLPS